MTSLYDQLSAERKQMQADGTAPEWYTTIAWQMFKSKYLYEATTVKEQFQRIAKTAAKHLKSINKHEEAEEKFFNLLWNGYLSPSTPILANMGTTRGLPVSCAGSIIDDSVDGFYKGRHEIAMLTKTGHGTASYLGNIRPRGSKISRGGTASGVLPVMKGFVQDMMDVSQGSTRRGAWAAYLPIDHGDFDEVYDFVLENPDGANIGWCISDEFVTKLNSGDKEAVRRYQKTMKLRMLGRGYYFFPDKCDRKRPQMYKDLGFLITNSQLCSEIVLYNDKDHTYSCVLSSMNVANYDKWKDTDAVFWSTVFLDCVVSEYLEMGKDIPGLEKIMRFTEKGRALGLGQCGFHTYLQNKMIPYESLDAQFVNTEIAKHIHDESLRASKWLAEVLGEPAWCRGYGVRNTHRTAAAPTKSTAELQGGVSEGINLDPAMAYTKTTAAGEVSRVNFSLYKLMVDKDVYNKKNVRDIVDHYGSVQHVNWLTDAEKLVFRTAFEINQEVVLRYASQRAKYLCQWQSLNLSFSAEENPAVISKIHQMAFEDDNILGLYYITTQSGVQGAQSTECLACQ